MAIFRQQAAPALRDAPAPAQNPTPQQRALSLQALTLTRGFEGLANLWNAANEVFVVAYAWDTAGGPVQVYPPATAATTDVSASQAPWISLRRGQTHRYLGNGLPIVPGMTVRGGLYVRLQLWESDRSARRAAQALAAIRARLAQPDLQAVIGLAAGAAGYGGAGLAGALSALDMALRQTTDLLQTNGDDVVDLFEGHWPNTAPWPTQPLEYEGSGSRIVLQPG